MLQILQSLKTGVVDVVDTPCPAAQPGHLLIRSRNSLISAGTERMLLQFGKAGFIGKARQQPDKVKQVIEKIKTDGLAPTLAAVRSKLDRDIPLGYCNVGRVLEVGEGVSGFQVGDRVVSNGRHAEVVCVPQNLCAKIPDEVADDEAAFTVIASIGLQGIRLLKPTLGECFVVTGLGLIGLLAVQILKANGCRVLGLDFQSSRLEVARSFGAETVDLSSGEDPVAAGLAFSRGRGVDGVLLTAATKSNEPIHQAAHMCRQRGRIVLTGVVGTQISRADFYEKELSFQVSCSYGPGRYDPDYEERGGDYPLGFVRWTEQRNFEAVLDLLAARKLDVQRLVSHRIALEEASQAYELVDQGASLGVLLKYAQEDDRVDEELTARFVKVHDRSPAAPAAESIRALNNSAPSIAFVGAGNFAQQVLIPAFKHGGARLSVVATQSGQSGVLAARKFGFAEAATDVDAVLKRSDVDAVVVATRHDTHADLVRRAVEAGKHVFVEKPLALNHQQLDQLNAVVDKARLSGSSPIVMVGFNRRFSPHVEKCRQLLASVQAPKTMVVTVNAGAIPSDHWVHDPEAGGGRIIGEGCHFVDLLRALAGCAVVSVQATMLGEAAREAVRDDKVTFTLSFADGSIGTVHYWANGHKAAVKERLEVFCGGRILQVNNFRRMKGLGFAKFRRLDLWRQDKGHRAEVAAFLSAVQSGGPPPIPFDELVEVSRATLNIVQAANDGQPVRCATSAVETETRLRRPA